MQKNEHSKSITVGLIKSQIYKKAILIGAFLCLTSGLYAQNFPPPSSCTSKDLELVGATLPGVAPCNSCVAGTSVTRTLNLSINNKTGSTRTSFAFWATLEVYNDNGTLDSAHSGPFSGCVGPIPSNSITTIASNSVTYMCGQSLKLTNLYLAWTDASPNSTCATLLGSPSTINPKCGTLPELAINAGVNAIATVTDATCTSNGSIVVNPNGGTPPYTVNLGATNYTGVTTSATFSNLAPATYTVTVTDANGCTVTKVRTINSPSVLPPAPVSGGNQTVCELSPIQTLTATATGSNITWYNAATNGNLVANPILNSVGTVTYYAQATVGTCVSPRTPVILTINPTPAVPVSGGNQTVCELSPIQTLTATATGSNITWYNAATNGNLVANPILNSVGTVTYYAQATLGSCVSSRTAVSLTINPTPAAPVSGGNQTVCELSPIQTLTATATGSNVTWYNTATNGNLVANPILNAVGTVTYYAQATLGSCVSSRTAVSLTINPTPAAPVSGGNQTVCELSPVQTLTATATGSNVTWYDALTNGNLVANPILNTVGTVTYYAQATLGSCVSSRTAVSLTINPTPAAPVSGGNQTVCELSPIQTLTATATGSNVTWYSAATNGNLVANPILNSVGTVTYYAQATLGSCVSSRTAVSLTINPTPAAPVSGGNQTVCELSPVQTLTATATGSNITWYNAATNGNLVTSPILNSVGTVTYYAQATLGSCVSSRTAVSLTINPSPAPPVSGGNQTVCELSPVQTLIATATGINVTWYMTATGGTAIANPTLSAVGSVTYYAQSKLGACKSLTRTPVKLKINPSPAPPISGGDKAECKLTPIQTLTATATGSLVSWYKFPAGGTAVVNPTLHAVGSITYYAQSKLGTCNSLTRTPVALTIYPNPAVAQVCITQPSLCGPTTGSITFLSPLGPAYQYSIDNGATWQAGTLFDNLVAGSVTGIKVNDEHGCKSAPISCDASDCTPSGSQKMSSEKETNVTDEKGSENKNAVTGNNISNNGTSVQVNPNPFTDKVKFEVVVPQSGNGTLEIYNVFGQKITTVFDGFISAGLNNFELNLPVNQQSSLIYKLTTDKNVITGKFYQIGN